MIMDSNSTIIDNASNDSLNISTDINSNDELLMVTSLSISTRISFVGDYL